MQKDCYIIALDAVGGDNAPQVVLEACEQVLNQRVDVKILLCGPAEIVESFCRNKKRVKAVVCGSVVNMCEDPMQAYKKKDSSIRIACELVKSGKADAFYSAGSTAACYVISTLCIGRINGIKYPAMCAVIPSIIEGKGNALKLLCDCGANANCEVQHFLQFAKMADVFARKIMHIKNPKIKLLNIGEEDSKGSKISVEVHKLLAAEMNNFYGNVEGDKILTDSCDVVIADGFSGNIALKTLEGTAKTILRLLKSALMSSTKSKIGSFLVKNELHSLKDIVNVDTYGGAPILGLNAPVIIGHGSSTADAISAGILTCIQQLESDCCNVLAKEMS